MILPTFARVPLVGYAWVVLAALAVGFLSFGLWVHHMFTTGLPLLSMSFFAAASAAIAIPMGIQVFAWIATLWEGRPTLRIPMLFVLGFLFIFTIGGLTGVMVAAVPYDWQVHDTYFVVAHFHYVLIGGMVFPVFAALYYWTPVVTGRLLSERLGRWAFWLMFIGFNGAFLPMHVTGLLGMPRRVYTFPGHLGWDALNLSSSLFSFVLGAGVLVVLLDFARHLRSGPRAGDNPWQAPSLEWLAGNKEYGFRSLMPIDSRYPLWEQPGIIDDELAGRGYLPDAPTDERQALVTDAISAVPEQIIHLPGPGWTAFLAAVATATAFAAFTVRVPALGILAALLATGLYVSWLWSMDRARPRQLADAGRGVALPLYRSGSANVGWWGMVVLLISDAVVLASFAFAYLFLWTANPAIWPPDGSRLPGVFDSTAVAVLVIAAWGLFETAERLNRRDHRPGTGAALLASATLAAAALAIGWRWLGGLGIDPTAHAYGAAVWTLLGYVAFHAALGSAMALWCCTRLALGMIDSWRALTMQLCLLWWRLTAAAAAVAMLLIAGFPHVVA